MIGCRNSNSKKKTKRSDLKKNQVKRTAGFAGGGLAVEIVILLALARRIGR
jgi:hypothetical protein